MCTSAVNSCSAASTPSAPTNGKSVTFSATDDHASIATFACNTGFTLSGDATAICDATTPDAPWRSATNIPMCTGDCPFPIYDCDPALKHKTGRHMANCVLPFIPIACLVWACLYRGYETCFATAW